MRYTIIQYLFIVYLGGIAGVQANETSSYTEPALSEVRVSAAEAEQKLRHAIMVVKTAFNAELPAELLQQTEAVVILPNVLRVSLLIGGKTGTGVLLFRLPNGEWSSPLFVLLSGGSIGLQLGASSSDMILFFRHVADLNNLEEHGKLTLTALAAVAAGMIGTAQASATDIQFQADIHAWLNSKGLFLGLALEGALLNIDTLTNEGFYNIETNFQLIRQGKLISRVGSVMELRSLTAELMARQ